MANSNERAVAAAAHVVPLVLGFGVLGWAVAFVIMLTQRERSGFATRHAIQSMTFQFVLSLWFIACAVLMWIPIISFIGYIGAAVGGLAGLVLTVMGAVHAVRGDEYEYPVVGRIYRRTIG
ncbi:MAG: DUF4870 domain-containing protein [Fimbriimonadaceae bacterium]|nr:DUF4870 domain-containing protein [Fimbriimonadaceae bacterium]